MDEIIVRMLYDVLSEELRKDLCGADKTAAQILEIINELKDCSDDIKKIREVAENVILSKQLRGN